MIIPLIHRIVVKPEALDEFSSDVRRLKAIGLTVPELADAKRAQAAVDRGVVISIGATAYKDYGIESPVKVGDVVNYARFAGKIIEDPVTEESFILLNDEDLICIIKD